MYKWLKTRPVSINFGSYLFIDVWLHLITRNTNTIYFFQNSMYTTLQRCLRSSCEHTLRTSNSSPLTRASGKISCTLISKTRYCNYLRFIDFIFRHNVLQNDKTKLIIHLYSEVLINVELENAIKKCFRVSSVP